MSKSAAALTLKMQIFFPKKSFVHIAEIIKKGKL